MKQSFTTERDVARTAERWQPDPDCIAAGDRYLVLAVRCFAAALLSDHQIDQRLRDFAGPEPPDTTIHDAPWYLVQHAIRCGAPVRQIVAWVARLSDMSGWPDPDEIAYLVVAALGEEARSHE